MPSRVRHQVAPLDGLYLGASPQQTASRAVPSHSPRGAYGERGLDRTGPVRGVLLRLNAALSHDALQDQCPISGGQSHFTAP